MPNVDPDERGRRPRQFEVVTLAPTRRQHSQARGILPRKHEVRQVVSASIADDILAWSRFEKLILMAISSTEADVLAGSRF